MKEKRKKKKKKKKKKEKDSSFERRKEIGKWNNKWKKYQGRYWIGSKGIMNRTEVFERTTWRQWINELTFKDVSLVWKDK